MSVTAIETRSTALFRQAQDYMPGGVNSPVRAFHGVGGDPLFFQAAKGAYLYDVDGNAYVDYVGSWGPMILGHAHPRVVSAVQKTAEQGLSFGAPCPLEIELAQLVRHLMPNLQKIRLVSSGTEATMTAIRLARAATGRDKIIKFAGCYHGHSDSLLVNAGSGALTLGVPSSPGIPLATAQNTLVADFNDLDSVIQLFDDHPNEIAGIIVEPIAGNMNLIIPDESFLQGLRQLCTQHGAILIFDEVMTGFRVAPGGAQAIFQIVPDLTTLGKIIGGGMPVGALGGKAELMNLLAPVGPVYQAGTLSGNPVAMAAGIATLKEIQQPEFYTQLATTTRKLVNGLTALARDHHIPLQGQSVGGMFGLYFTDIPLIDSFERVKQTSFSQFQAFFHHMLKHGVYFAPSAYEAGFVSSAHGTQELETTLKAADQFFKLI